MTSRTPSLLLSALLLVAGGAYGQGAGAPVNRLPSGEASTTVGGRPNANPDDPRFNKSRAELQAEREAKKAARQERQARRDTTRMGAAGATTAAGEASTIVRGRPNANPDDPRLTKSREALQSEREEKRASRQAARDERRANPQAARQAARDTARMGATGVERVPPDAGEASTVVGGRPNANPDDPRISKSREEIQAERDEKRAQRQSARDARRAARGDAAGAGATR